MPEFTPSKGEDGAFCFFLWKSLADFEKEKGLRNGGTLNRLKLKFNQSRRPLQR